MHGSTFEQYARYCAVLHMAPSGKHCASRQFDPLAHAVLHEPQCCGSFCRLTQVPEQHVVLVGLVVQLANGHKSVASTPPIDTTRGESATSMKSAQPMHPRTNPAMRSSTVRRRGFICRRALMDRNEREREEGNLKTRGSKHV